MSVTNVYKKAGLTPAEQRNLLGRVAIWPLIPANVRAVIIMAAGFPRERVKENLDQFSDAERRRIWETATFMQGHLSVLAGCVNDNQARVTH